MVITLEFVARGEQLKAFIEALKKLLTSLGIDPQAFGLDELIKDFTDLNKKAVELGGGIDSVEQKTQRAAAGGKGLRDAFQFNNVVTQVTSVAQALDGVLKIGRDFQAGLAEISSITGLTGSKLDSLGGQARQLALRFGGEATEQLKSFTGVLSKLGPAIAEDQQALAKFAENINVLSAASGDDAATSMAVLADAMLQLGLAEGTAAEQAKNSTDVINALAAGAQVGAAEIPQVGQAILQAGVAAKGANLDIVQVNAAIQALALGGKQGSEAGVGLRNVLALIQDAAGPAQLAMSKMGTSSKELGEILTTQGLEAALRRLKTGFDTIGSDAEKNAALFQIFGTQNASSAGILLDNVDKMAEFQEGIKDGMTGVGTAFEQANIRLNTASSGISTAGAFIKDVFISLGTGLGDGLNVALGTLAQFGPQITALSGLKGLFPTEAAKKFGIAILSTIVPGLITATGAQTAQAAATNAATVAQYKFNAAALLNPYVLGGALIIGAVVGAFALFSDSVKSAEDAVADLNTAQQEFNTAAEQQKAVKSQADGLKKLADEYDSLKGKTDPESQKRFAEVTDELARKVPSAANAIEVLNEKGQLVGYGFEIATTEARKFADEQEKIADEAAADALENLKDQAAAAAATYLDLEEKVKGAREERDKYQKLENEGKGDVAVGFDWESVSENLKDARGELNEYIKEQEKLTPELRKYITEQIKAKKSVQDIANELDLPVEAVQKLSAEFSASKAQAEAIGGPLQKMSEHFAESALEAKELGEALDATLKGTQDLARGSVSAVAQALANLEIARRTGDEALAAQSQKQIDEFTRQGKEALIEQQKLEQYIKDAERRIGIFKKVQRSTTNKEIIDAEKTFIETLKELNDELSIQQMTDALNIKLEELRQSRQAEIDEANKTAEELRKKATEKGKQVLNQDKIKEFEEGGQIQLAIAKKYTKLEQEARLDAARDVLDEERRLRSEGIDLQISKLEEALSRISDTSEEAIQQRIRTELQLLTLKQTKEIESIIETDEEYVRIYSQIIEAKRRLDGDAANEEKSRLESQVEETRLRLEERRNVIIESHEDTIALTRELESVRTSLTASSSAEEIANVEKRESAIREQINARVTVYSDADEEITRLQSELTARQTQLVNFSSEEYRTNILNETNALKAQLNERITSIVASDAEIIKLQEEAEDIKKKISESDDDRDVKRLQRKEDRIRKEIAKRTEVEVSSNTDIIKLRQEIEARTVELEKFGTEESRRELDARIEVLKTSLQEREIAILDNNETIAFIQEKYSAEDADVWKRLSEWRYAKEVEDLETTFDASERIMKRHADQIKNVVDIVIAETERQGESLISQDVDSEIARLERLHLQKLLSDEEFEKSKTEIQRKAEEERSALAARAAALRAESERQAQLAELQRQKENLEKKFIIAQQFDDEEAQKQISRELKNLDVDIEDKSSLIQGHLLTLQGNMTEIFSNLFTGNPDDIKGPFKKLFANLAGILQRWASAKVTEVILSIPVLAGIPGLLGSLALRPAIEGIINSLLTPVLKGLTSFAEGSGPISTPGVYILGDTPPGMSEQVVRDDHMEFMMIRAAIAGNNMAIPWYRKMISAIEGQNLSITEEQIRKANTHATARGQIGLIS